MRTTTQPLTQEQKALAAALWPLACFLADRFRRRVDAVHHDAIDEGTTLGCLRAARRFDPRRGLKTSTYLAWCIRSEIADARRRDGLIRMPRRRRERRRTFSIDREVDTRGTRLADVLPQPEPRRIDLAGLVDYVASYSPRLGAIARAAWIEGLLLREIAARCGVSPARIAQQLALARRLVRERFTPGDCHTN